MKSEYWSGKITYYDVGAIVYSLKTTPWLVNNFSVNTHLKYITKP